MVTPKTVPLHASIGACSSTPGDGSMTADDLLESAGRAARQIKEQRYAANPARSPLAQQRLARTAA